MKKTLPLLTLLLSFTACTLHDPYCRPDISMPNNWRFSTESQVALNTDQWWKEFKDPVLDQFVNQALEKNPDLLAAMSTVDAFAAQLQVVRSQLFPQVNANVGVGREKVSAETTALLPGVNRTSNVFNLYGNFSYFLDFWGQVRSSVENAQAQLFAQEEIRKNVVLTLVTAVSTTYISLRQYDEMLRIATDTLVSREQSYNLALLRFELGLTSEMPVMQSLAELDFTNSQKNEVILAIGQLEDLLSILIGDAPKDISRGSSLGKLAHIPNVPAGLPSNLLNQRPDIRAAEQRLIAANANIGVAKAAFFPQITLTGLLGQSTTSLTNIFTGLANTYQYGANIIQEIFTGGYLSGNLKLTRAQKEVAVHQYQSTILNAFKEVNDALIGHQVALEQIKVLRNRVEALNQYYTLAELQYTEGEVDYLNVLDAERQLFEAQLNYIEAYAQGFLSVIDIYKALGGSWVDAADQEALNLAD
ncbi:MAG: efflux transporter outer membrane subunit [Parachlamydiales bacterium]|nr:efflux transporter outer membrane subunit [Parachlamydiales bacterium]